MRVSVRRLTFYLSDRVRTSPCPPHTPRPAILPDGPPRHRAASWHSLGLLGGLEPTLCTQAGLGEVYKVERGGTGHIVWVLLQMDWSVKNLFRRRSWIWENLKETQQLLCFTLYPSLGSHWGRTSGRSRAWWREPSDWWRISGRKVPRQWECNAVDRQPPLYPPTRPTNLGPRRKAWQYQGVAGGGL